VEEGYISGAKAPFFYCCLIRGPKPHANPEKQQQWQEQAWKKDEEENINALEA
jgi:hypothetical protein